MKELGLGRSYQGTLPLKQGKIRLLSQHASEPHARSQKKSGKLAMRRGIGGVRKRPCLRVVSMHEHRVQGYRELGVPTKNEGFPTIKKRIEKYSSTDRAGGCKEIFTIFHVV